ncbi:hypothetical protein CALVIDRAFT_34385 [Calocera viscosa TUFC12733]|uniref:Uncharacterized protein n=1 Tax=Calocera viscosa (strain TUFC12733) TaxID=1330018 RepID=A0A167FPR7_CALVF|nr:hypothetical protein CALVIDRAFT_34385 [Calocera viscosa TUFC12733]
MGFGDSHDGATKARPAAAHRLISPSQLSSLCSPSQAVWVAVCRSSGACSPTHRSALSPSAGLQMCRPMAHLPAMSHSPLVSAPHQDSPPRNPSFPPRQSLSPPSLGSSPRNPPFRPPQDVRSPSSGSPPRNPPFRPPQDVRSPHQGSPQRNPPVAPAPHANPSAAADDEEELEQEPEMTKEEWDRFTVEEYPLPPWEGWALGSDIQQRYIHNTLAAPLDEEDIEMRFYRYVVKLSMLVGSPATPESPRNHIGLWLDGAQSAVNNMGQWDRRDDSHIIRYIVHLEEAMFKIADRSETARHPGARPQSTKLLKKVASCPWSVPQLQDPRHAVDQILRGQHTWTPGYSVARILCSADTLSPGYSVDQILRGLNTWPPEYLATQILGRPNTRSTKYSIHATLHEQETCPWRPNTRSMQHSMSKRRAHGQNEDANDTVHSSPLAAGAAFPYSYRNPGRRSESLPSPLG